MKVFTQVTFFTKCTIMIHIKVGREVRAETSKWATNRKTRSMSLANIEWTRKTDLY